MFMTSVCIKLLFASLLISVASVGFASELASGESLFKKKCSLCHAIDKKKLGPAVNRMSRKADTLHHFISKGKGMMPAFEGKLTAAEIDKLVGYLLANQ